MRPEYIFMDLDGTISDPKEGITKAVAHALSYYGIRVKNLDTLEKFIGPPLLDSFQDFYGFSEEQSREAVGKYREYFSRQGLFENVLYDGMKELLAEVASLGKKIVIATSKPEVYTVQILKYFEIEQYFYFVAGSTLDGSRSKKGDVIRYALDSLKITADQAVMVGDRKHDVIGAKENGMYVIGVLYGYGDRAELEEQLFHIEEYVGMVLTYMRCEGHMSDFVMKRFPLDRPIREAVRKYRRLFIKKGIALEYGGTEAFAVGDEKWVAFVIEQIVSNSLKYTEKGSRLTRRHMHRGYGDRNFSRRSSPHIGKRVYGV